MEDQAPGRSTQRQRNGTGQNPVPAPGIHLVSNHEVAFGYPRDFLENQFVYVVISPRAKGLSVGINLNPHLACNFNCIYCELDHSPACQTGQLDIHRMIMELGQTLELVRGGWLRGWSRYARLPDELLEVRHVALSGDGEPTLSADFVEAVQAVLKLRQQEGFFKIVLLTNSTTLDQPQVEKGLALLTPEDEVWVKLDGGTQEYLNQVNGSTTQLTKILGNILLVGRKRPVVVQSLFPLIHGEEPSDQEVQEYAQRLKELKEAGAMISLVQIYSANRPMARPGCGHLPLKTLSRIARTVRQVAKLPAEVF